MSNSVSGQSVSSSSVSKGGELRSAEPRATANVYSSQVVQDSLDSSVPQTDEGITVKGAETHQGFRTITMGELEEPKVIILRLKGTMSSGKKVETPITVKTKITCSTCGKKSKSNVKFCANCGTFIQ